MCFTSWSVCCSGDVAPREMNGEGVKAKYGSVIMHNSGSGR